MARVQRSVNYLSVVFDLGKDPVTGKRKQKRKRGFKTKKEAEKYINEQLNSINKGMYFESIEISLSDYLDHWLEKHAKPNTAQRTYENYQYMINVHLKQVLGHIKISKLQPSHLQEYYAQKLSNGKIGEGGLSVQSVKQHHRLIFKALKDAVRWQLIVRNVAESVTPPKTRKVEMQTWDNEQFIII